MMIFPFLACLSQIFTFGGGTVQDLVDSIAHSTGHSCIAEIYDGDQLVPSIRTTTDAKRLGKSIQNLTGYSLSIKGGTYLLTTGFVSPVVKNFRSEKYSKYGEKPSPIGVDETYRDLKHLSKSRLKQSETITIQTSTKECVTLADMAKFSTINTPWRADWAFQEVPLALSVSSMDPSEFISDVGQLLGARVVSNKTKLILEFSGAEYRKRFIHSANDPVLLNLLSTDVDGAGNPGIASSRLHFNKEAIQLLSDQFLEEAFAKRGQFNGRINFEDGHNPKLKKLCDEYAFNLISAQNRDIASRKTADPYLIHDFQTIDTDTKPTYFFYHAPSEFYIALHEKTAKLTLLLR